MSLKTEVRNAIAEICMEKYQKRIEPRHVNDLEIFRRLNPDFEKKNIVRCPKKDINACLKEMARAEEVTWGREVNYYYFRNVPKQ